MNIHDKLNEKFKSFAQEHKIFDDAEKFVLLFSGGKDCTFLLDMILKNFPEVISKMEILCVMYPHHVYTNELGNDTLAFKKVKKYWNNKGLNIKCFKSEEPDFSDDDRHGCKICKKSRKLQLNPYVDNLKNGTRLLVGLTLYDVLAYYNILLLSIDLNLKNFTNDTISPNLKTSLIKTLHKMKPIETFGL